MSRSDERVGSCPAQPEIGIANVASLDRIAKSLCCSPQHLANIVLLTTFSLLLFRAVLVVPFHDVALGLSFVIPRVAGMPGYAVRIEGTPA